MTKGGENKKGLFKDCIRLMFKVCGDKFTHDQWVGKKGG